MSAWFCWERWAPCRRQLHALHFTEMWAECRTSLRASRRLTLQAAPTKPRSLAELSNAEVVHLLKSGMLSPHTLEVPFAFGTTDAAVELVGTGPEIPRLVRQTMARWVSFARHGVPSAPGGVSWPTYDRTHRSTMMLDVESHVAGNPGGEARQTLDDLPYFEYSRPASFVHA